MPITSVGYPGQITVTNWPVFSWNIVNGYTIRGENELRVSAVAGDRRVAIAPGLAVGCGIMDTVSAPDVTIDLPAVTSGSRWDLIALRRNWGTSETTIVRIEGTDARAIPAGESGRKAAPGVIDDQPLALVRVMAGSAAIQEVVDLRVFVGAGGAFALDMLALSYFNQIGTRIVVGVTEWQRRISATDGTAVWVVIGSDMAVSPLASPPPYADNRVWIVTP